jgi:hypothetical protein
MGHGRELAQQPTILGREPKTTANSRALWSPCCSLLDPAGWVPRPPRGGCSRRPPWRHRSRSPLIGARGRGTAEEAAIRKPVPCPPEAAPPRTANQAYHSTMNLAVAAAVPGVAPLPRAARPRCARLPRRGGVLSARAATSSAASASTSSAAAAAPVYAPTPQDRPLRTPHSG